MRNQTEANAATKRGRKMMMGCLLAGLVAAGAGLSQRAAAAEEGKQTVSVGLNQLNGEIQSLRGSLARTVAALQDVKVAAENNGDLAKPYASFNSSYTELETQVASLRAHATALKARSKEHWEAWQKELTDMQNAKLREKAQKRYTVAYGEFEKISKRADAAKESFAPLAADLKDINTYLKTDLSKDAVSSLSGTIWKMNGSAKSVDSKLADVGEQIDKTIKKLPQ